MSAMPQQLRSDLDVAGTSDPLQHRPLLTKLDILAVDADDEPLEEWEAEDVSSWDHWIHEKSKLPVRRKQSICGTWMYEVSTEAEARARTGRNPVGLILIDTNKGGVEVPRYCSRLVCTEVRHEGSNRSSQEHRPGKRKNCEDVFQVEDPFLISIADVSRAHFHADAVRDVCVPLPDEAPSQSSQACA